MSTDPAPRAADSRSHTILIVDDNINNLMVLSEQLRGYGFTITVARSGEKALERVRYAPPDLILLDVVLPGMDGFETCRRLKAEQASKDIPVIFMTVLANPADTLSGFEAGGVDYIAKPFQYQEVVARVTTHVRLRELSRQLQAANASLAGRVAERTAALVQANEELQAEIVERQRAEEALRASEERYRQAHKMEAIGRLAGGIAHDFNNLLTAILGYAALVLDELDDAAPLRQEVQAIQTAGERAAALTRQLLAFSRQQVLQPELLNLNTVVVDLSHILRRVIGEDIELITIPGPGLGMVKADPSQLEQVILNLVVNARDAMPAGGKLTIETTNVELDAAYAGEHVDVTPGAYALLAISDTGHGMDAKTQNRIFEPFFTTKEAGKGTGLGLAMVHGIVSQSGGHIWVYSEIGHGSTFKIYLPVPAEGEMTARARPSGVSVPHGCETVLLVEDDEQVRQLADVALRKYSYMVLKAANGVEALQLAQMYLGPIDVLVTDVILPGGLSGLEVAEQLVAQRPQVKVVYMSGYTDQAMVHHGVLEADLAFLQKPFTPEVLARKVREVLDTRGQGKRTTAG